MTCNTPGLSNDIRDMNNSKAAEALTEVLRNEDHNIRRAQLDYLGSAISLCVLTILTCIVVYLITIV